MSEAASNLRVFRRRVSSARAVRDTPGPRPEKGERIQSGSSGAGHHALGSSVSTRPRKSISTASVSPARVRAKESVPSARTASPRAAKRGARRRNVSTGRGAATATAPAPAAAAAMSSV